MKQREYILQNPNEVLTFLKSQYPLYHLSNLFFRDVQYGIQKMFERRGEKIGYPNAEKLAHAFVEKLEKERIFERIDRQSWVLHYPEFKKPMVVPAAPAKPAPGATPVKSPAAGGTARPALPPLVSAKPAGAKPSLPSLASARPAGGAQTVVAATATPAIQVEDMIQQAVVESIEAKPEPKAQPTAQAGPATAAAPVGARKPLPPLRGNYTPAGKK